MIAITLCIALAVLATIMGRQIPPRIDLPFDVSSTTLAAEFTQTPDEINAVYGAAHRWAPEIKTIQYIDFAFIPCYVALFALLGWTLRRYDVPGATALSWMCIIGAIAAGVFDVLENISILAMANRPNVVESHVRTYSLPKWGLAFLVLALESVLFFFWPKLKLWWRLAAVVIGFGFLVSGALGLLFTFLLAIQDLGDAAQWMAWSIGGAMLFFIAFLLIKKPRTA
jgi:hypothetical protein